MIYFGIFSLYSIYLYTSAFFIYDCFFLTLLGDFNFLYMTFPKRYYFTEDVGFKFIVISFIHLFVTHILYCFIKIKKIRPLYAKVSWDRQKLQVSVGKAILLMFIIPMLYKIYLQVSYISSHGYASLFSDSSDDYLPFWVKGAFSFFLVGYVIFLSGKPEKKEALRISFLFFIVFAISSLRGQRGPTLGIFVFLLYWFKKNYSIKIHFAQIFCILIFIIAFTAIIGNVRSSYGKKEKKKSTLPVSEIVQKTLWSQTTSRAVPMLIIRGNIQYRHYPFIFSPFFMDISKRIWPEKSRSEISAQKYNGIGTVLLYNVSKEGYLNGYGYGGAFIGEAYDCGGVIGLIFWSVFLAYIIKTIELSFFKFSKFFMPILILFLRNFALLPRSMLFYVFYDMKVLLLVYFIIIFIRFIYLATRS